MSKHFEPIEFISCGFPWTPSMFQSFLMENMVNRILEPIRSEIYMPMKIIDCMRSIEKTKDLAARGLNPSQTSDHYWGQSVPLFNCSSLDKAKKYGNEFHLSVGAVDFTVENQDLWPIFKTIIKMVKAGYIDVGQLIYEQGNTRNWIHISNPKELVYTKSFCDEMFSTQKKFLVSSDCGKHYIEYIK